MSRECPEERGRITIYLIPRKGNFMNLIDLLQYAMDSGGSDLFITAGKIPSMRRSGIIYHPGGSRR